ncbi:uncharacterized protein METZ01_LOCUS293442 [marine metagenome]|uniref:Uncharacterized protein n=1 Tax=marine metagenome TaxID=408172 RepID=A0A382LVM1_9ZZZZ
MVPYPGIDVKRSEGIITHCYQVLTLDYKLSG